HGHTAAMAADHLACVFHMVLVQAQTTDQALIVPRAQLSSENTPTWLKLASLTQGCWRKASSTPMLLRVRWLLRWASAPTSSSRSSQAQVTPSRAPRVRRSTLVAMPPAIMPAAGGVRRL